MGGGLVGVGGQGVTLDSFFEKRTIVSEEENVRSRVGYG